MQTFCTFCGAKNAADARFCAECRKLIATPTPNPAQPAAAYPWPGQDWPSAEYSFDQAPAEPVGDPGWGPVQGEVPLYPSSNPAPIIQPPLHQQPPAQAYGYPPPPPGYWQPPTGNYGQPPMTAPGGYGQQGGLPQGYVQGPHPPYPGYAPQNQPPPGYYQQAQAPAYGLQAPYLPAPYQQPFPQQQPFPPQQSYPVAPYGAGSMTSMTQGSIAEFWPRLGAWMIDWVCLVVIWCFLGMLAGILGSSVLWPLAAIGAPAAYFIGFWSTTGRTPGYQATGLQLVKTDGAKPTVGTGIIRYVGTVISWSFFLLGYLWMLWDPRRQTWHDKMAGTVVVRA